MNTTTQQIAEVLLAACSNDTLRLICSELQESGQAEADRDEVADALVAALMEAGRHFTDLPIEDGGITFSDLLADDDDEPRPQDRFSN